MDLFSSRRARPTVRQVVITLLVVCGDLVGTVGLGLGYTATHDNANKAEVKAETAKTRADVAAENARFQQDEITRLQWAFDAKSKQRDAQVAAANAKITAEVCAVLPLIGPGPADHRVADLIRTLQCPPPR